jgi:ketosteroid isomerase-like protein
MWAQVRRLSVGAGLALAIVQMACQHLPAVVERDTRADENAIRQLDLDWSKAVAGKDIDKVVAFYAEDGALYPPNSPIAAGQPALKVAWTGMMNLPGFQANWVPSRVEVAGSGDLGWSTGTYTMTMNVPGNPATDHGKYVAVWKKQKDGDWKAEAEIFNSDLPVLTAMPVPTQQSQALPPMPR